MTAVNFYGAELHNLIRNVTQVSVIWSDEGMNCCEQNFKIRSIISWQWEGIHSADAGDLRRHAIHCDVTVTTSNRHHIITCIYDHPVNSLKPETHITTRPHKWLVNNGSGNSLVTSGNRPLPEPMWTKFMSPYVVTKGQLADLHTRMRIFWQIIWMAPFNVHEINMNMVILIREME